MRAVAGAALAALALSGCGDAREEFRDDLRPLEERAAGQRTLIAGELRSLTLGSRGDARVLRAGSQSLRRTYGEIAELEPPEEYEEPFAAYVATNQRTVRQLDRFVAALEAGDAGGVRAAGREVVRLVSRSQRARLRWLE